MAVRKFLLNIGQSNAGPLPDMASWQALHPFVDFTPYAPVHVSPTFPRGSYSDTFVMPTSVFPNYGTLNINGRALNAVRYLTFYDPIATGYGDYPNTMRVNTLVGGNGFTSFQYWTASMAGVTLTRRKTGTTHTVTTHTAPGNSFAFTGNFDPPLQAGELFTYPLVAAASSGSGSTFQNTLRFGQDWTATATYKGSLEGCWVRCVTAFHAQNVNERRQIASISGAQQDTINLVTAFAQHVTAADTFVIEPPTGVTWDKWAYFLPWTPFEGGVTADRPNPFPPGFNYPQHFDVMPYYNPYTGSTLLYQYQAEKAAWHIGMGLRLHEHYGESVYVVSLSVGGSSFGHRESGWTDADSSLGWYDSAQQTYWMPGEGNALFQRLLDTLDAAVTAAAAQGDTLQCVGIFCVQGEADAGTEIWADYYRQNLQSVKTAVRNALVARSLWTGSAASIPWIHPKVKASYTYSAEVNAALDAEADADRYMRTLEVEAFPLIDGVHYDGVGATMLEAAAYTQWLAASAGVVQDASPLVVEDGVGTPAGTETSYCSSDFAGVYFQNQGGIAAWNTATEQQRNEALMQATIWIDQNYGTRFVGLRSTSTQPLEWPRAFAYDRDGYELTGIPLALKRATAEMARRWLEDKTQFQPDVAAGSNVTQDTVTVGPITISKTYAGGKDAEKRFKVVDRLFQVAGLIDSGGWAKR